MLKALARTKEGGLTLVVGVTAQMAAALIEGRGIRIHLPPGVHFGSVDLEYGHDDETLIREWAAHGLIPPGQAVKIQEEISAAREAGEDRKIFNKW